MDELSPGEAVVDRPAKAFTGEYLCDDEVYFRSISAAQGLEKCGVGGG